MITASDPLAPFEQLLTRAVPPRFDSLSDAETQIDGLADGQIVYIATSKTFYGRVDGQWVTLRAPEQSESVATLVGSGSVVCTLRNGWVCLTISIASAGLANGGLTTVANVPAPFRPASSKGGGVYLSGYPGSILVSSSGDVQIANQSGAVRNIAQGSVIWPEGL